MIANDPFEFTEELVDPQALAAWLLDCSDEALVICVHRLDGEPKVAIRHKFKDTDDGILNKYLATMLEELLDRCNAKTTAPSGPPATVDPAA